MSWSIPQPLSAFYSETGQLARLAVRSGRSKVLEIIVLHHQLGRLACAVSRVCASNAARMVRSVDVESAPAGPCRGWFVDCGGAVAAAVI